MNNFYLPKNKRNNLYIILFKNINFKFIIINKIYRLKIAFINNYLPIINNIDILLKFI